MRLSSALLGVSILLVASLLGLAILAEEEPAVTGTGFVVNPNGYLLTCAHVVEDAVEVKVSLGTGSWEATVLGVDETHDLALLQIPAKNLPPLPLADAYAAEVGQEVRVFGYPLSDVLGTGLTVTHGTVARILERDGSKAILIDAAVNPGNSGGPLVTEQGSVLGVISIKFLRQAGMGSAVPINYATPLLLAQGVRWWLRTEGASGKLDGPALVKLVSPSVAVVTAWTDDGTPPQSAPAPSPELLRTLAEHTDSVRSVAVTPDGSQIVSASDDKTIAVCDLSTGAWMRTLTGHTAGVSSVAVTPDGSKIISGSDDKTVKVWNLGTGVCLRTLAEHGDWVRAVAVTPDGTKVVSGSDDKSMKVWDLNTGACLRTLAGHTERMLSVAITQDGSHIVSGSADKTIKVWDPNTGALLRALTGHTGTVYSVAVSPDGGKIVSGSDDKTIKVWDLGTGACLRTITGHTGMVYSVAVSPDGGKIVSGSDDKTVKVWDLGTGACMRTLTGHTAEVHSVAASPDGDHPVSASADKTIMVWKLMPGV